MSFSLSLSICVCIYMYIYVLYTNIYVYLCSCIRVAAQARLDTTPMARVVGLLTQLEAIHHRWNRNPRPQPNKFSKLVFLTYFT